MERITNIIGKGLLTVATKESVVGSGKREKAEPLRKLNWTQVVKGTVQTMSNVVLKNNIKTLPCRKRQKGEETEQQRKEQKSKEGKEENKQQRQK
jgi:hypothetical protein